MIGVNIQQETTPNCGDRNGKYKTDMIVFHIAEGSYEGTISWLKNPASEVSSHFVVSRTGRITQLVNIKKKAFANGTTETSTKKYYYGRATNKIVLERGGNANDYTISIENEGFYAKTGGKLTDLQLKANVDLVMFIREQVKTIDGITIPIDRDHLIGHSEICPKEKPNCPGNSFQWDELIHKLKIANGEIKDDTVVIEDVNDTTEEIDAELYEIGRKIILNNAFIYPTSTTTAYTKKSGTFYIYDGKDFNGRFRITNAVSRVNKTPIGSYVSGYIGKNDIPKVTIDTEQISIITNVEPVNKYAIGAIVKLSNTSLFATSIAEHSAKRLNGTYYIYDGKEIDGRYRITDSKNRVAQGPISENVTGYINKSSIV